MVSGYWKVGRNDGVELDDIVAAFHRIVNIDVDFDDDVNHFGLYLCSG